MTIKTWAAAVILFSLASCMPSNKEEISSSVGEFGVELEATVEYELFPFEIQQRDSYGGYINSPTTQPLIIQVSGGCGGLQNSSLGITNKIEDDQNEGYEQIQTNQSGHMTSGPEGMVLFYDQLDYLIYDNADSFNQKYVTNSNPINNDKYKSFIDCQNSKSFKFTIFSVEEISKIITQSCSHDEPYQFMIQGNNQNGEHRRYTYNFQLSDSQCEKLNPCDDAFEVSDGVSGEPYNQTGQIFSWKQLFTSSNINNNTDINKISDYSDYNDAFIACNPDHLFSSDTGSEGYTRKMSNASQQHKSLYLYSDIDGAQTMVQPIGSFASTAMKADFNGFKHSISRFEFSPTTAGDPSSLFYKISSTDELNLLNFRLVDNSFIIEPSGLTDLSNLPALSLLGEHFTTGASRQSLNIANLEIFENRIILGSLKAANGDPTPISTACTASGYGDCLFNHYDAAANLLKQAPLVYSPGPEGPNVNRHWTVRVFDNQVYFTDENIVEDTLFKLTEY